MLFTSATAFLSFLAVVACALGDDHTATPTSTTSLLLRRLAESQSEEETETTAPPTAQTPPKLSKPEMYSLYVTSRIEYRFANTVITSRLANPANQSQEIYFSVTLPETAYISKFQMEVKGKVYTAYVKEKEAAKQEYDHALSQGLSAAHVALSARDSNRFTVSVNVEPLSKVTFNLTYEELLTRRLGTYNHVVNLDPGQVVADMKVNVYIKESRNITDLRVPELRSGNEVDANELSKANPLAVIERRSASEAHVSFAPTPEQQKALGHVKGPGEEQDGNKDKDKGLGGQFVVQYDVSRDSQSGEVLVNNGYFVHFFAPTDLPPLRKHALFVLDVSGSMEGRKIEQLKEAMDAILDELNEGDYFNIIEFSYSVTVWHLDSTASSAVFSPYNSYSYDNPVSNPGPTPAFPATPEYIAKAKDIVKKMRAGGGTNIYDTLKTVIKVSHSGLENVTGSAEKHEPIIVFLTDGEPTVGETRLSKIFSVVQELNTNPEAAIFSLAFGEDADLGFLRKLSIKNSGFARKIYEASDAALQLRNFYRQIASPLLANVTFSYVPDQIIADSTTKQRFHTLFSGSELIVAGRLKDNHNSTSQLIDGEVSGFASTGDSILRLPPPKTVQQEVSSLERLWAYLTIQQLLENDDKLREDDMDTTNITSNPKKEALELALKYSFVTPLTSLVVVKPNETSKATEAVAPVESDSDITNKYGGSFGTFGPVDRLGASGGASLALSGVSYLTTTHGAAGFSGVAPHYASAGGTPHYASAGGTPHYASAGVTPHYVSAGVALPGVPYGRPESAPQDAMTPAEPESDEVTEAETTTVQAVEEDPLTTTAAEEGEATRTSEGTPTTNAQETAVHLKVDDLAWFEAARNGSDITLPFGTNQTEAVYRVELNNTALTEPSACVTRAGQDGRCVHLQDCVLGAFRDDVAKYRNYFCLVSLDNLEYAGVCCPPSVEQTTKNTTPLTTTVLLPVTNNN